MGLTKLAEKVADYNARLEQGKASKIEPNHVRKVLEKLGKKVAELEKELAQTEKAEKKERLTRKLRIAREQIERANWLLQQIT